MNRQVHNSIETALDSMSDLIVGGHAETEEKLIKVQHIMIDLEDLRFLLTNNWKGEEKTMTEQIHKIIYTATSSLEDIIEGIVEDGTVEADDQLTDLQWMIGELAHLLHKLDEG